jgi:hypothetical protein
VNADVEQTRVLEHLNAALSSSHALKEDLLTYLIEMALTEARTAFDLKPMVTVIRNGKQGRSQS